MENIPRTHEGIVSKNDQLVYLQNATYNLVSIPEITSKIPKINANPSIDAILFCFHSLFFSDIEAQIREIQSRKKEASKEGGGEDGDEAKDKRIALGESGYFDTELYEGGGKYEGYVTSIAANDEVDVSVWKAGLEWS